MKKLLLTCMLIAPLFASAETLRFNTLGDNFRFKNYNLSPNITENKAGQFGSYTTVGNAGSRFSFNYLALASKSGYNNNDQKPGLGKQASSQNNLAIPGLDNSAYKTIAFKNGHKSSSVMSLVVLNDAVRAQHPITNGGAGNHSRSASFGFVAEFSDGDKPKGIEAPSAVPTPAALPLLATAIGLFGFAANRRRV